jgi:hypothetical protein
LIKSSKDHETALHKFTDLNGKEIINFFKNLTFSELLEFCGKVFVDL